MDWEKQFDRIYSDFDKYMIVPVALITLSLAVLGFSYIQDGEVLSKGLDFTGGTELQFTVQQEFTTAEIQSTFESEGRSGVQVTRQVQEDQESMIVQVPPPEIGEEEAKRILEGAGYNPELQSQRFLNASVSDQFFTQAMLAFVMAFTIMSLVIFYAFRDLTPSLAVIFAAAGDIIFSMAGMVILGIPLTLGSLAALLMLIGYSVDTDIVLSTRVLKRTQGTLQSRIWNSVKTGVTMSSGGIAGFTLLYIISRMIVGPSELSNIAAVMVLGLVADMPLTWFGNAIALKKYVEGDWKFEVSMPWK